MYPKEFIKLALIDAFKEISERHPYISFGLICLGIELIGKCNLTNCPNWHDIKPDKAFKSGVELMTSIDSRYADIELKDELRNGFAHTLLPKSKILLGESKNGVVHFSKSDKGQVILVSETFYQDFAKACQKVIDKEFPPEDKMNKPFLHISST